VFHYAHHLLINTYFYASKTQNVHKMGHCWLRFGWMEILAQPSSEHYNTHSTHYCIYYTREYIVILENCLQRELTLHFTVSLVRSTSTVANRTLMWSWILPNHTWNLEVLVISVDSLLCHTINEFPKRDSPALILHTTTNFLHLTVHIFQKFVKHHCKNIITDMFCVTIYTIIFWPHILDVNNKWP
jgi:hypothetical protein